MESEHPAQIKWKDPLALARDIRKRLHLIADPSVRLDMEACCDAIEKMGKALELIAAHSDGSDPRDLQMWHLKWIYNRARAALR
jgi:hypothetical protein